uniref:Uncharacterized protein n=1 Tax=Meloidogyne floridensis TaxID=298350 RepID=A0A915PBQ4_9BILA
MDRLGPKDRVGLHQKVHKLHQNFYSLVISDRLGHTITCYKNNGFDLGIEEVRCSPSFPSSPTYCLKANVYDGRVVRDCATSAQCPQGNACSPINYEEDGTTGKLIKLLFGLYEVKPRAFALPQLPSPIILKYYKDNFS